MPEKLESLLEKADELSRLFIRYAYETLQEFDKEIGIPVIKTKIIPRVRDKFKTPEERVLYEKAGDRKIGICQ